MERIEAARAVLHASADRSAWPRDLERLIRKEGVFLNVDFGQEPEDTLRLWREIVGDDGALEVEIGDGPEGHTETLRYKGATAKTPLIYDRVDSMLTVLTLAQLVRGDVEIRLVRATIGDSTLAFLPLPAAQWTTLEQEHGAPLVRAAFSPLPATLADFDALIA